MEDFAKTNLYRLNHTVSYLQGAVETAVVMRHEYEIARDKQKSEDVGDYTEENVIRFLRNCSREIKETLKSVDMYLSSLEESEEA
ncbi:hypothetical protein [Listeria monocytogenes]|uniref:Uncharacterized protein n=2 Tax=Listeria monocytogenes TaxID=1639 RepID=A0A6C8N2W0_LISMN|nr:hypothetical protein [Listeria monocytogenes]KAA9534114.1 hypothetical protein DCK33_08210 [Listeria monocytogenes]KAA9541461.1 hypothetical protein DCK32_10255 [Listeria monocytogenes]